MSLCRAFTPLNFPVNIPKNHIFAIRFLKPEYNMSVIQQIQEKYAKLMAIIIAIALIIFIVMLAFENGGSLLRGSNSNVVGKVDGQEIDATDFRQKVDQYENYLKQQYGPSAGAMVQQQALQSAWEQEVGRLVLKSELD